MLVELAERGDLLEVLVGDGGEGEFGDVEAAALDQLEQELERAFPGRQLELYHASRPQLATKLSRRSGDPDGASERLAGELAADALGGAGGGFGFGLRDAGREREPLADLAVDLHDHGHGFVAGEFVVPLGPGLFVDRALAAAQGPELLGDVRRGGSEAERKRVDRFVPGVRVDGAGRADAVIADAGQRVGELHHRGDHRVETEALDVVGDLADHRVGLAADFGRAARVVANARGLRARAARRA